MASFSVVIPLYNKEHTIERAIRSVVNQTIRDFEIIVVNDGSTDSGPQVVEGIRDTRIRLIQQYNRGVSVARNRGIAEARFNLVAFLDADDEWKPEFLETIMGLRRNFPQADVFATSCVFCAGNRVFQSPRIRRIPEYPWEGILEDYFEIAAISDPPIYSSAVAVTKPAISSVGGFPVGVTDGEDLLTWARLAAKYSIAYSTSQCAVFWIPQHLDDRPGRNDYTDDVVGRSLWRLLEDVDPSMKRGLRDYIFRWYKSTSSILLELGKQDLARREIQQAFRCRKLSPKMWVYLVCSVVPPPISRHLVRHMLTGWRTLHRLSCWKSCFKRGRSIE